ncbi:MAG TPA: hypothetical protein PLS50_04100 [Candidatus Dojkabacteria bacterium]|nr:hypothetical protein [Candidatus Dojkabacteria bacterium]
MDTLGNKPLAHKVVTLLIDYGLTLFFLRIHLLIFSILFWSIINDVYTGLGIVYTYLIILVIFFSSRWIRGPKGPKRRKAQYTFSAWIIEVLKRTFVNLVYVFHSISLGTLISALLVRELYNTIFTVISNFFAIFPSKFITIFIILLFSYSIYMLFGRNWIFVRKLK